MTVAAEIWSDRAISSPGSLGSVRMLARFSVLSVMLVAPACSWIPTVGGHHKEGERVASVAAFYGSPILGKAIAWHGLGDVPNTGIGVRNLWYQNDRVAVGAGLNLLNFQPRGDNVIGGELEGRLRYHFGETDNLGFFWDLSGGYMRTESQIPPGGTRGNYTFALGPGIEALFGDGESVVVGIEFHHMSNALGRDSSRNPSMNEFLFSLEYTVTW